MLKLQQLLFTFSIASITLANAFAEEQWAVGQVADGYTIATSDWPWWRGPRRNGTASEEQSPPTAFSADKNVLWKSKVPGRGHGSPTVFGTRVFLPTAIEQSGEQLMLCFDRSSGQLLWKTTVHATGGMRKNEKSTAASSTAACDGERIYINFPNAGKLITSALTLDGQVVWQTVVSDYEVHQGYGASPALYQNTVIVSSDNKGGGAVAALHAASGEVLWHRTRPQKPNYASPTLLRIGDRDQLVMVGCDQIVSYNPRTGETLWETSGATTECVTSTVTDGKHIYTSGGYPKNHMSAILADGSASVAWENDMRLYVPSLVIHEGYLYGILDAGIAMCWKADTGEEQWKKRIGGNFTSSPVLVGNKVFATNEVGEFTIFEAKPSEYSEISTAKLGDQAFATPTFVSGKMFHRVAELAEDGTREEYLYCIGE